MSRIGEEFERGLSKVIHSKKIPVLISSKLLREYKCGQVDIAYVEKNSLKLIEAKSSGIGVLSMQKSQRKRLNRSAALLNSLLGIPVDLKFIAKRNSKFYP